MFGHSEVRLEDGTAGFRKGQVLAGLVYVQGRNEPLDVPARHELEGVLEGIDGSVGECDLRLLLHRKVVEIDELGR